MTNDQIRAFLAVVEHGSFRAAATALYKTQPTISSAIRTLEEQFEIQLFDRSSYRPQLTIEGEAFYRQAQTVHKQLDDLEALGYQLAQGLQPILHLAVSPMCASAQILQRVKELGYGKPDQQLDIKTEHLSGILETLQTEESDLAIGPSTGLDHRFEFKQIAEVRLVTVATPEFVNHQTELSQQQLRRQPHILLADTGTLSAFEHVNVIPGGQRWMVHDFQMKKALLLSGMGWSRMPYHMVYNEIERGELLAINVENFVSNTTLPVYLIRLKNKKLNQIAEQFWRAMTDMRKESPSDMQY